MDDHQLLAEVVELLFSLSLDEIDLVFEGCELCEQGVPVLAVVDCLPLDFFEELADFFVLDGDDFLEAI